MVLGLVLQVRDVHVLSDDLLAVANRRDGRRVLVEEVDLLERETLGLGNAEVGEDEAAQARRAPNEEHLDTEAGVARTGVDEVGSGVTDTEVPEPVGRDGERHGLGTDVKGEDLAGDDPRDGSPGGGEGGNVDANKGNERLLAGLVVDGDSNANDRDEVLADTHDGGTVEEERAATEPLDTPHTRKGHEHVDDVGGDRDQEGVLDTRVLEEGRAVYESQSVRMSIHYYEGAQTYSRR